MKRTTLPRLPPERRPSFAETKLSRILIPPGSTRKKETDRSSILQKITSRPQKPQRSNHTTGTHPNHGTFWRHLPKIESYEQAVKFPVDAPQRVLLRLERLMGTTSIRPIDSDYMKTLRGKIEEEEIRQWQERAKLRKRREYDRCRKLVINGHSDPLPGTDLYKHPVLRVNRLVNRLAEIDNGTRKVFREKLPPIVPVEPFEEYEVTGLLFGSHPNHHLKVERDEEVPKPSEEQLQPSPSIAEKGFGVDRKPSEGLIRDLEEAKKRYGINPDDLEKMWRSYESPLIKMVNAEKDPAGLFECSNKVIDTMKREEKFSNDFPHRTYWRLRNAPSSSSHKSRKK